LGNFQASAQTPPTPPASSTPSVSVSPVVATVTQLAVRDSSAIAQDIARRRAAGDTHLPDADHFTMGNRAVAANTSVDGPVAVARGDLDVYGTVVGDVVALDGNIRIHKGALVTGDAWAAAGSVIVDGGLVEGQMRAISLSAPVVPSAAERHPLTTWESVKLVLGWFAILVIIGIGVMVFAEGNLDGVVLALERSFARSFWIGIAGQVIALPALLVLVVGLALTVIGVLLIPFAIVAYVIAVAGLVTLGFLAVARLTGGTLASSRGTTSARGVHLRGLVIGLVAYLGIWMLAAVFTSNPVIGAILRALAVAITWVAATLGLGATLTSRAGTQRAISTKQSRDAATDDLSWQTPTPVSGVAAATRRVASVK
jgi:hypothetical protein